MMRFVTILFFSLLCWFSTTAEEVKVVEKYKNLPVSTLTDGRFELVQAPGNSTTFLLDKYTGRIWEDNGAIKMKIEEIMVESRDSAVDTTCVNYQLYIHINRNNYARCFLLNIHTGDMWKHDTKKGKSVFEKIQMPWNR